MNFNPTLATQIVAILTAVAGGLMAWRKFIVSVKANRTSTTREIESLSELNASMREELRKDNENLRERIARLEKRVEEMLTELERLRAENHQLEAELESRDDMLKELHALRARVSETKP